MVWSPKENDAFFGEPQEDAREPGAHADDAETMCVWCETRVRCACKSHYDTLTCTHRVIVPTAEEWDSSVEARAAELHEGCRMPMEQARELATSEASPDWYARGQDWGLADALTNGQSGDWVLDDIARAFAAGADAKTTMKVEISSDPEMLRRAMAAETEAALLRAALDQKHAEYEDLQRHGNNTAHNLARMQAALAESASRSAGYLRKAIKAEAEVALLRAALNGGNVIARLQFALQRMADAADGVGVKHFDTDWLSDEVQELQAATHAARLVLGPNAKVTGLSPKE